MKFQLGQTVMTAGVSDFCAENNISGVQVSMLLMRHQSGDWGDVCKEDWKTNDRALKNGDRILSSYKLGNENVWVITEWDRSVTTILFPSEY